MALWRGSARKRQRVTVSTAEDAADLPQTGIPADTASW
jgi:hypothetical protein